MGPSPSCWRALAIAVSVVLTHALESSYCEPEQLARKFGCGAMSAGGFCGGCISGAVVGWDGAAGRGTMELEGARAGAGGLAGVAGGTVVLVGAGCGAPEEEPSVDECS